MRVLLDTQIFLWWLTDDPRLPQAARQAITDPRAVVHVSAASLCEIFLKEALGRIELGEADLVAEIAANGFIELPITAAHAGRLAEEMAVAKDPFGALLLAQARSEGLSLICAGDSGDAT